jgi:uncharacterized protein YndB with AHSA1/START domain
VLVALRVAAPAARTFTAFTAEIGEWWQPNGLFRFTDRAGGRLAFEPDPPERLVEIGTDGERFEIGPVTVWEPPYRLVFGWRQAGFPDDQSTEVSVRFDSLDQGTRVTVEHFGWDGIPQANAARHGFPLADFQQRLAEWWQVLLHSLGSRVSNSQRDDAV